MLAVMVLLASRPPEVLPRLFPASSQRTLTPAQLLSYRNMFPSNLIEASFQQVSSPSSTTTGGWDGAGLQRRLLSCLGTLPHPQLGHRPLPFPLPPSPPCLLPGCFLLTPGQAPKAGRVLVRTLRDTPACPPPGRAPVQQQHNVFSLGPSSCAGASPSLGIGEQRRRGGQAAGVGKESLKERLGWMKGRH